MPKQIKTMSDRKSFSDRYQMTGISVLIKSTLRKGVKIFEKESCDEFVWWKLEKDFFHLNRDIFICSVYIPPINSPRGKRLDVYHFATLQDQIITFQN